MNADPALSGLDLIRGIAAARPAVAPGRDAAIPFTLVCGYLGSGKTTFINRLLADPAAQRIAVLVNDFGAINIDARLIRRRTESVIELENGCACCSLAAGLTQALGELIESAAPPEAIYMEASGVAEPNGIVLNALSCGGLRLELVLCVADAENLVACAGDPGSAITVARQIAGADLVILNKMDIADVATAAAARACIASLRPDARIFETRFAEVPAALLVGPSDRPAASESEGGYHEHAPVLHAWHMATERPLDRERFSRFVEQIPVSVYRAKGIVPMMGSGRGSWVLQMVGRRWSLEPHETDLFSGARLVFIGDCSPDEIADLTTRLQACAA